MIRRALFGVSVSALLVCPSSVLAVDFFWTGPLLGGPGGNFRTAANWTYTPPPFPLDPAPGGASDTADFDLGRSPENRYTVANVNGENDQLLIHDDSLRLQIDDYELLSVDEDNLSFIAGVTSGDEADVILQGVGNATLRTRDAILGLGVASFGEVTVDHLQWDINGSVYVGGRAQFVSDVGGDGVLTIQNGSLLASDRLSVGRPDGSIGEVVVSDSSWTVDQAIAIGSGIQGSGTLIIQDGGTVFSDSGSSSSGVIVVEGPGSLWSMADFLSIFFSQNPTVTIRNGGTVIVGNDGDGPFTCNSTSVVTLESDGVLDVRGPININTGTFNFLGGTLHAEEFNDTLVNQGGTLAPGNLDQPAGSTNIAGNYTHQLAATLEIDIGGTTAGTQHDFLNVEGTALLAGALELSFVNGFEPDLDDTFVVLNSDSLLLGGFVNVANGDRLVAIDGSGSFLVHYGPTSTFNANQVVLTDFLPGLPGDYNQDDIVDAADYVTWRKIDGSPDGYDTWVMHFGEALGNGGGHNSNVPESTSILLISVVVACNLAACRGRSLRQCAASNKV